MKPVSIEITAFGPYVTRQFVDFSKFHDDGLFLIRGNTGAGKTTILDAMCLALYGKLPGARSRSVVQLDKEVPLQVRPAAADDADPTKVVFVVDIGERRFRFTRIPAFRKSTGALTVHKAVVEEEVEGGWQPRLTRIDEIGQFSRDYVGLDVEQFSQLILLPQGEFATFLRANFKDREDILQTLFPLQVYADIEKWFTDQRKAAQEALDAAIQQLGNAWVELRTTAETDGEQPEDVSGWVATVTAEIREAMSHAHTEAERAATEAAQIETRINDAESSNRALVSYRAAVTDIQKADAALTLLERRVCDESLAQPYSASLPAAISSLEQQAEALDRIIADASNLAENSKDYATALEVEAAAESTVQAQLVIVESARLAVESARTTYDQFSAADVDVQKAEAAVEKLQAHAELLHDLAVAQEDLKNAQATEKSAKAAVSTCEKAIKVEGDRLDRDAAAALATQLEPGQPCLVCGSVDHPKPARSPRTSGDAEVYAELLENLEIAQNEFTLAQQQLAVAQAETSRLTSKVSTSTLESDHTALATLISEAREALENARAKVIQREQANLAVQQAEADLTSSLQELETLRTARENARIIAAGLAAVVQQLATRVPDGFDVVQTRSEQSALRMRSQTLASVLTEARTVEDAKTAAQALLEQFSAAAEQAHVEIDPLRDELKQVRVLQQAAVTQQERCRTLMTRIKLAHTKFEAEAAKVAHAVSEADLWKGISPYVEGNAGRKIPLTRFYLAQRLAQVAAAASTRLRAMSGGRYELVHDDSVRAKHGAQGGLALLIRDNENACTRGPETLSGGETFMASLALALGLSDVVTAESGGVRLDSLFIDEGFGSLDSDTLEEVLDVLEGLREHNRLVGVVSHVDMLKERIPQQLLVEAGPSGSTVSHIGS